MHVSTEHLTIGGLFLFFLTFTVTSAVLAFRRSHRLIQYWASAHGCSVLEKQLCIFRGPFFWSSGRSDQVYRLTIRDATGHVQSGWVKVGSGWRGIWTPAAPVVWKGESDAPPPLPVVDMQLPR